MKKFLNAVFVFLVFAILLFSVGKAILMPGEINEYENRYMAKLKLPGIEGFISGEFQDATDSALADQLPHAILIKEFYNTSISQFNNYLFNYIVDKYIPVGEDELFTEEEEEFKTIKNPDARYYSFANGIMLLEDHLMYPTRFLEGEKAALNKRIANMNSSIGRYKDVSFYLYYIEKETDIDFVTGERSGIFEYLRDTVNLPSENVSRFNVTNFEDFDKWFYKTDHHLNLRGADECYRQLLAWLLPGETALEAKGLYQLGYYSGSKANGTETGSYKDIIACYSYDYPDVKTLENGKQVGYYGAQEYYIKKVNENGELLSKLTYGQLFGQDSGEVRTENSASNNGSILLLGESMDNALIRLLSSHYSKLYSVDTRNYKKQMGEDFSLSKYLKMYPDIDKVLFIGNLDYFVLSAFNVK